MKYDSTVTVPLSWLRTRTLVTKWLFTVGSAAHAAWKKSRTALIPQYEPAGVSTRASGANSAVTPSRSLASHARAYAASRPRAASAASSRRSRTSRPPSRSSRPDETPACCAVIGPSVRRAGRRGEDHLERLAATGQVRLLRLDDDGLGPAGR